MMRELGVGLTPFYARLANADDKSGATCDFREQIVALDYQVTKAYGWGDFDLGHGFFETKFGIRFTISPEARREILQRLLKLNLQRHAAEALPSGSSPPSRKARKRASATAQPKKGKPIGRQTSFLK
jgi:hypothetical protein